MKKYILSFLSAVFMFIFLPQVALAACDPVNPTNCFCDFSPAGNTGGTTGDVTISNSCAIYETVNGVSEGNLTIDNGAAITLYRTLAFDPGYQINVDNGLIYINTGGQIQKNKICIKDADGDGYADTTTLTTDPNTGLPLTTALTQIATTIADTSGACPSGYTSKAQMNNLTLVDANVDLASSNAVATPDRELLRLGFTIDGVTDVLAAAGDTQLIGRNLLLCNSTSCPTTSFPSTSGNLYVDGSVGVGLTNPVVRLTVFGSGSGASLATSGTSDPTVNFRASRGTVATDFGIIDAGTGYIQNRNFSDLSTNYPLSINPNGGNVGIGKTNPSYKLDVAGNTSITGNLYVSGNTDLCTLVTYTAGSGTVTCPTNMYTWAGVASATGGQMLCCKVSNPI